MRARSGLVIVVMMANPGRLSPSIEAAPAPMRKTPMKTAQLLLVLAISWLAPPAASAQDHPVPDGHADSTSSLAFSDDARRDRILNIGSSDAGTIKVTDANQLGRELNDKGRINVYGILFDVDKADIRPESQPQLAAIADLLKKNPGLELDVLAHTDIQGGAGYNLKLSDMRAFAVVAELSLRYDIDRARLNPLGKGLDQPVASNADEAGRALNRRVELVRR